MKKYNISYNVKNKIKNIICSNLIKYNYDVTEKEYVQRRIYQYSNWILCEEGTIKNNACVLWYKSLNDEECMDIMKKMQLLYECIAIKEGDEIDKFSTGFIVQEMADNYDLLIFEHN